jgi:tetratricopeptide (TPR) repeat protein
MERMRALAILCSLCAGAAWAEEADDPDTEIAQRHFQAGSERYNARAYEEALREFEAARGAKPVPALDYNIGRCYDRLERYPEAVAAYRRYLAAEPEASDAAEVRERVRVLEARAGNAPALALVAEVHERPPRRLRGAAIGIGVLALAFAGAGAGGYLSAWSDYRGTQQRCAPRCDPTTLGALDTKVATAQAVGGALFGLAAAAAVADIVLIAVDARRARATRRGGAR